MIPIVLVTGFLGSGKTTLLQHFVDKYRAKRLVYLINEFSAIDIDGRILDVDGDDLVSVAGGSIFCKCLVSQFVGQLNLIARKCRLEENAIEGVVVEASGIANPKVVMNMLQETELDKQYRLARVISVIDPGSFLILTRTLPNISAQVEASDIALLNKTDLYSAERLEEAEVLLRKTNPSIKVVRTERSRMDIDVFSEFDRRELIGEYAQCADPNYGSFSIAPDEDLDLHELMERVNDVRDDIYRLKGFARIHGKMHIVDMSTGGLITREMEGENIEPNLVFIVRGDALKRVEKSIRTGCAKSG